MSISDEHVPVLVLLSGGIDSTATAEHYRRRGHPVEAVFVDYGQPAARREEVASSCMADHLGIPKVRVDLAGLRPRLTTFLPGRNGLLVHAALVARAPMRGIVALGIHAGTDYPDCTPAFVSGIQHLLDLYVGGTVRVGAPFVEWRKEDVWTYALEAGLPLDMTYSCELGLDQPCGRCLSCADRIRLDARP